MPAPIRQFDAAAFNEFGRATLPGHLGIVIKEVGAGFLSAEAPITPQLMAPNGFLHAGSVVALADTATGYACVANLPEGAHSFTTVELKANFLGTARAGTLHCEAKSVHLGRTTQVWDAQVWDDQGWTGDRSRPLALFRCTQLILYPR